jgi:hypothetical protein
MLKTLLVNAALTMALVAQTPAPQPEPTPSAGPSPTPSAMPSPTATPAASPTPLPTPLVLPADAPPQILAIQLSDPIFHSGETVTGTVITSTNVAAVEIHLAGRTARIPRADLGVWQVTYRMPRVPFFMRGDYTAQVVAMNSAGATAVQEITVPVR